MRTWNLPGLLKYKVINASWESEKANRDELSKERLKCLGGSFCQNIHLDSLLHTSTHLHVTQLPHKPHLWESTSEHIFMLQSENKLFSSALDLIDARILSRWRRKKLISWNQADSTHSSWVPGKHPLRARVKVMLSSALAQPISCSRLHNFHRSRECYGMNERLLNITQLSRYLRLALG